MLQQLTLENFKGLKSAKVDFGRFTVLIGLNGTGKSSISQALLLLRQSMQSNKLETSGPLVNLGTFSDILSKEVSKRQIGIGLSVSVGANQALGITSSASYSCSAYFDPELVGFEAKIVSKKNRLLTATRLREGGGNISPSSLNLRLGEAQLSLSLGPGPEIAQPVNVTKSSWPSEFQDEGRAFERENREFFSAIGRLLNQIHCVPAIRGLDSPDYDLGKEPKMDFVPGKNEDVASTFAYSGKDVEEIVAIWAESITGSEIGASIIPGRKVAIRSYAAAGGIPVIGDGFGTNQLVQLLLTLAIVPSGSVLIIEEPEIHLHPKAQENLCDVLIRIGKAYDRQLILSTHSEHVLYRFVEAVRNKTLTRDELAIYYFEEKGKEPYRVVQDKYGDIYDWGKNFFR